MKGEIYRTDISHYSKPAKTVFTLAEQLLKQGYITGLDNYYGTNGFFSLLNQLHIDAVNCQI
jgi:hypothetical protein